MTKTKKAPQQTMPLNQTAPRSKANAEKQIFTQRLVQMRGQVYWLRVFEDSSCEFTRFDIDA